MHIFLPLDRDTGTLTNRHQIVFGEDFPVHLLQILMNVLKLVYAAGITAESATGIFPVRSPSVWRSC